MLVLFELFEQGFLRLGHGTANAVALALELAHIDAGARRFGAWLFGHQITLQDRLHAQLCPIGESPLPYVS